MSVHPIMFPSKVKVKVRPLDSQGMKRPLQDRPPHEVAVALAELAYIPPSSVVEDADTADAGIASIDLAVVGTVVLYLSLIHI